MSGKQLRNDPYIQGAIYTKRVCEVCHTKATVMGVSAYTIPASIDFKHLIVKPQPRDYADNKILPPAFIGITCGCYARLHRQVAHILDSQKQRKPS